MADTVYMDPWKGKDEGGGKSQSASDSNVIYADPYAGKAGDRPFATKGEAKYRADADLLELEGGPNALPDELKAFAYSAGESGLFGVPSLVAAAHRYYGNNLSWEDARKEQQQYIEALQRQHPNWSMAGTAAGVGSTFFLPGMGLGTVARLGSGAAEAMGAGKLLQTAAGGAGAGAAAGAVSSGIEDYMKGELTPQSVTKGALIGGGVGAVASPIIGMAASKFVAPVSGVTNDIRTGAPILTDRAKDVIRKVAPELTDAEIEKMTPQFASVFGDTSKGLSEASAREAILKASGVTEPSMTMTTGFKPRAGTSAREVSEELRRQAIGDIGKTAESFVTPGVSQTAGAEALAPAARELYDIPKKLYKTLELDRSMIDINPQPFIDASVSKASNAGNINALLYQTGKYDGAQEAQRIINQYFAPNIDTNIIPSRSVSDTFAIMQYAKDRGLRTAGGSVEDRRAVNAVVDGFKQSLQEGIVNTYSGGAGSQGQIAAIEALKADANWSKYMKDLFPSKGADAAAFKRILSELADKTQPTFVIDPNPTEGMINAAQGLINSNLIKPGTGRQVYERLEKVIGTNTPAMNNFNALIRNQMMDVGGDYSKLSAKIKQYTSPDLLPVTLKAFGADTGNLSSLASSNADSAATQFAKQKLMELRKVGTAADIVYADPKIPNAQKPNVLISALNRAMSPALAFLVGGHTGSILNGIAAYGAGEGYAGYRAAARAAQEGAGAPRAPSEMTGGFFQRGERTVVPGIRDVTSFMPPETPPDYVDARQLRRASGGRVTTAEQLLAKLDQAEKQDVKETKSLLNLHDNTVAKALEIANKHI